MITVRTDRPDATRAVAAAVAELARPGDLLLLVGDLGAGKTSFVQGFGRALGVTEQITSPTFTLARQYRGRLLLHHLDVYRLEQLDEVLDLGLSELLDSEAVVLIEWGDAILPALPADYLEIHLAYGDSDDDRVITLRSVGRGWAARGRALEVAVNARGDEAGAGAPDDEVR
jgi:tRNA threonylcarbamoyladenosine biosynthesis protein TsaE